MSNFNCGKMNFKYISGILYILITLFLGITILINRIQVYPTDLEKMYLEAFFENQKIENEQDIIGVQNKIVGEVSHISTGSGQLNIINTLKFKKGLCFDRSLVLQKYFILKGYKIRPVYLFWGNNSTSIIDLMKSSTQSHNVFEIYFNNNWYLVRTNNKMEKLEFLSQYLASGKMVPTHTRYIRYLNNRNGEFIYPSYIPDIYFF
jgi:hypothetical protein